MLLPNFYKISLKDNKNFVEGLGVYGRFGNSYATPQSSTYTPP